MICQDIKEQQYIHETNINDINDDCLIHVFEYLSLKEKLELEKVCKRWNRVGKLLWNSVKSLEIAYYTSEFNYLKGTEKENTIFLLNVLERCSTYLTKVSLCDSKNKYDISVLIDELADSCDNIVELSFGIDYKVVSEESLEILFNNNKKLKTLVLQNLCIRGYCLSNLNKEVIEDLKIDNCIIEVENTLFDFLCQLKNLKKLYITYSNANIVMDALIDGSIENITEFTICSFSVSNDKFVQFFLKQKNLRKINFKNHLMQSLMLDRNLIESLPVESLEEIIDVKLNNDLSSSLHFFRNLTVFTFNIDDFTDRYARDVTHCVNLKKLSIEATKYALSQDAENGFCKLENLETFFLSIGSEHAQGNILVPLSKCKNLKKLIVKFMMFSSEVLMDLEPFPNLEYLDVDNTNLTNEMLAQIVLISLKLDFCSVIGCENINNEFVKVASVIKAKREDIHKLMIYCNCSGIKIDDLLNVSPLIALYEN